MFSRGFVVFAAVLVGMGLIIALASLRGEPQPQLTARFTADAAHKVTPAELSSWIITGRRDFSIVDLRKPQAFDAGHIPGAVNCGHCHESKTQAVDQQHRGGFVDLSKKIVVYTESGREEITLPRLLATNPHIYRLAGGYAGWSSEILSRPGLTPTRSEQELHRASRREAVRAFMAGERPSAGNVAQLPLTPIRRTGEHKVATANEGC